jgi:hypothetical protein
MRQYDAQLKVSDIRCSENTLVGITHRMRAKFPRGSTLQVWHLRRRDTDHESRPLQQSRAAGMIIMMSASHQFLTNYLNHCYRCNLFNSHQGFNPVLLIRRQVYDTVRPALSAGSSGTSMIGNRQRYMEIPLVPEGRFPGARFVEVLNWVVFVPRAPGDGLPVYLRKCAESAESPLSYAPALPGLLSINFLDCLASWPEFFWFEGGRGELSPLFDQDDQIL